jgi:hypothetical protein
LKVRFCGMQIPTVVFILSSERSGSTWAGYVLGSNPGAEYVGEFYRAWNDDLRLPCAWCSANGIESCGILGDVDRFSPEEAVSVVLNRTSTRMIVDTSKRIDWAERLLPAPDLRYDAFLIHLIRDPRGWYASTQRRRSGSRQILCEDWLRENLAIRNFIELENVPSARVFYDEMAAAPEHSFSELCREVGLGFEPASLRYWTKPHHAFAANGASSPVLGSAPRKLDWMITGDDAFYEEKSRQLFVDSRWREDLSEEDILAITEDPRISGFLQLYGRVLTSGGIHRLTDEDHALHRQLEGSIIRTEGETPTLQRMYIVTAGRRHWVTHLSVFERLGENWRQNIRTLDAVILQKLPAGAPIRHLGNAD